MNQLAGEESNLLMQAGDMLALHADELAAGWQRVLEATAVFHERLFTPEELSHICWKGMNELIEALRRGDMYNDPEAVRERGEQFAHKGLGGRSLAHSLVAWQDLCLSAIQSMNDCDQREQVFLVTARALSRYASFFAEGFIEASRDLVLQAQDDMVMALEQSLREREQWWATTLKSIGDGVIVTDTKGMVTFLNSIAEQLTGWSQNEAVGAPLAEVFNIINEETRERCKNPFEKIVRTGKIVGLANNTILIAKDDTEKIIADSGAPIRDEDGNFLGTVLVFRDITEKRMMIENILRSQTEKMESISILAGGIAHDFNNILTAILGNITISKTHAAPDGEIHRLLTEAEKASLRAKDLTQQLLTFSKGGAPVKKPASISELLKTTCEFALSGSKAGCTFAISADLWTAEVDAGQISQVINNLVINADQSMPAGGTIEIRAENVTITAKDSLPLKDGNYVKILVIDGGIGIPKEHLQRIFDPYFTTKQKGSGLGLATSYSIVKNHDGCITVKSSLGVGTTFSMYLPASSKELETEKSEAEEECRERGRILLMDDEESILEATGEVLTYLGYEVEAAGGGLEALELYRKAQKENRPFDAVIIDLTIRGKMGGKETMENLLKIDPEVKGIVSSGYCDDPVMTEYKKYGFKGVVTKPYTIEELKETLHRVIHV